MRRREVITFLGGAAAAWPLTARAQQQPVPVIGFLHSQSLDGVRQQVAAFRRALNEGGYAEGQNVAVEYRWADGKFDRVPELLADLVQRQVTLIVAGGGTVAAVKAAGTSIPTIFTTGSDPVQQGLVPSLSRPGGNMTGVFFFVIAMGAKQLEMLLAAVPSAMLIGFLSNPSYPYARAQLEELEAAAHTVGRKILTRSAADEDEINTAFDAFSRQGAEAVIIGGDPFFFLRRAQVVALVAKHNLPACYGWREFVTGGGLMSYGANLSDAYRQVGAYAALILKGAKSADLPVVQATKIELVLNLKTAKMQGVTFPINLLGRADEVIE